MAVLLYKEFSTHRVEETLELPQVILPLDRPAFQAGHDRAALHGQEICVLDEAESAQSIESVDHVHGVVTGTDHAGGLVVLVLREVGGSVATLLQSSLHVSEDIFDAPRGDDVHVVWEEDDISNGRAVSVICDDVGNVYFQVVRRLIKKKYEIDLA